MSSSLFRVAAVIPVAVIAAAAPALGADFTARIAPEKEWTLVVSPYVWTASLGGKSAVDGFSTDVDVPFSQTFENLNLAAMGNVELTNDKWGFYFDGQYVKTSQEEDLLGSRMGLDIKTTTLSGGAFFTAYESDLGGNTVFGKPRIFSVEPTAGVRWTRLEADVSALGLRAGESVNWTDPFAGVRVNADLTDRWNLFSEVDTGGFGVGSKISINAQSYLGYRTTVVGNPTIFRLGYRVLYQDYEGDEMSNGTRFRWDVTQHGPVVGISMLF